MFRLWNACLQSRPLGIRIYAPTANFSQTDSQLMLEEEFNISSPPEK